MNQKIFDLALGALLYALCFPAQAQQSGKIPRIGFLSVQVSPTPKTPNPLAEAFGRVCEISVTTRGKTF